MIVVAVVHDRNAIQGKFHGVRLPLDNRGIAQEQRLGDPLLGHQVGGADDHRMLSFGQDDALGAALGPKEDLAHELPLRSQAGLQLLDIDRPFGQGRARHTAFHGGFGHGRHHFEQHPRIQWLGDDVVGTEMNRLAAIGADHASGTSSRARSARACTAASFMASLISVARTSRAPRKMKGNPNTLLTWLG